MGKREYLIFLALVFELVGLVIGLVYAGYYLDQRFQFTGVFVTTGAILAIVIWVIHLIQAFKTPPDKNKEQ